MGNLCGVDEANFYNSPAAYMEERERTKNRKNNTIEYNGNTDIGGAALEMISDDI